MKPYQAPLQIEYFNCKHPGEFRYIISDGHNDLGYVQMYKKRLLSCIPDQGRNLFNKNIVSDDNINNEVYFIEFLYIEENHRRKGLGKKLLEEVINKHGNNDIFLNLDSERTSFDVLHQFYSKYNFETLYEWEEGHYSIKNALMVRKGD